MSTPEESWPAFEQLVHILTQDDLLAADLKEIITQIAILTQADSVSIDAYDPLALPAATYPVRDIQPVLASQYFRLSYSLSESSPPPRLFVERSGEDFNAMERAAFQTAGVLISHAFHTTAKVREERVERLLSESLRHFSEELTATLELEEVLELILDQFSTLIPYESANVLLFEEGVLQMHAHRGYQQLTHSKELPGICFVPERTVGAREVLACKQAVVLSDTTMLADWLWLPCGAHVRSWMGVPLLAKGQLIGMIQIDKAVPNFFNQKHVELAMAMAVPAALVIENARMLAQIRETKEQLRGLSAQVMQAQEQERSKLAVELHDHAGQALLGLRAELQVLKRNIPTDCKAAIEQIATLDAIIIELSRDLRQLALELHPPLLSELGLIPALEQYLEEFKRRLQIPIRLELHPTDGIGRFSEAIELVCYRVVQEALTNLARHAQAKSVKISFIITTDHLNFSIQDDGIGLPRRYTNPGKNKGFGLLGMRERVLSVGGEMQIWSQARHGTRIEVDIPLMVQPDR